MNGNRDRDVAPRVGEELTILWDGYLEVTVTGVNKDGSVEVEAIGGDEGTAEFDRRSGEWLHSD